MKDQIVGHGDYVGISHSADGVHWSRAEYVSLNASQSGCGGQVRTSKLAIRRNINVGQTLDITVGFDISLFEIQVLVLKGTLKITNHTHASWLLCARPMARSRT